MNDLLFVQMIYYIYKNGNDEELDINFVKQYNSVNLIIIFDNVDMTLYLTSDRINGFNYVNDINEKNEKMIKHVVEKFNEIVLNS